MKTPKAGSKGPARPQRLGAFRRGRPTTRSRTSLLWSVWRLVREEIAYRAAPNVSQACEAVMARTRAIRVVHENGEPLVDIADSLKLRQWYAAAERARMGADSALRARCAAWEANAAAGWDDFAARSAYAASLAESSRAGLDQTGLIDEACRRATDAAARAAACAGALRTPRKNRR